MKHAAPLLVGWVLFLSIPFVLSGCCDDCPSYRSGILKVRMDNADMAGLHMVYFDVSSIDGGNVVASGAFSTADELAEAYARREGGEIFVFVGDQPFDVQIYVDMNDDGEQSVNDMECLRPAIVIIDETVVDVDYSTDFTAVN